MRSVLGAIREMARSGHCQLASSDLEIAAFPDALEQLTREDNLPLGFTGYLLRFQFEVPGDADGRAFVLDLDYAATVLQEDLP